MKKYEDSYGREFYSAEEALENWEKGCDELIDDEDEEAGYCNRSNGYCEFCQSEIDKIKEDVEKEKERESDLSISAIFAFYEKVKNDYENSEEILEQLQENRRHNGRLTSSIVEAYDEEDNSILLHQDEIDHIITMLGVSSYRHNCTNYENMLAHGIDRELARQLI